MEFQYNCLQRTCYPICLKMAYLHFKLFHLPTSSIIAFFSLGPKPYRFCSLSWVARVSMQYLKVPLTYFIAGTIKKIINSFIELIYAPKKIIGKFRHFSYLCQDFKYNFCESYDTIKKVQCVKSYAPRIIFAFFGAVFSVEFRHSVQVSLSAHTCTRRQFLIHNWEQ